MNWLAFITDLIQIAAPIFEAHSTGKSQAIAETVDHATAVLKSQLNIPTATGNQKVDAAMQAAPVIGAIIQQFTTTTGHKITVSEP